MNNVKRRTCIVYSKYCWCSKAEARNELSKSNTATHSQPRNHSLPLLSSIYTTRPPAAAQLLYVYCATARLCWRLSQQGRNRTDASWPNSGYRQAKSSGIIYTSMYANEVVCYHVLLPEALNQSWAGSINLFSRVKTSRQTAAAH